MEKHDDTLNLSNIFSQRCAGSIPAQIHESFRTVENVVECRDYSANKRTWKREISFFLPVLKIIWESLESGRTADEVKNWVESI